MDFLNYHIFAKLICLYHVCDKKLGVMLLSVENLWILGYVIGTKFFDRKQDRQISKADFVFIVPTKKRMKE